jgi:hypothetical protein
MTVYIAHHDILLVDIDRRSASFLQMKRRMDYYIGLSPIIVFHTCSAKLSLMQSLYLFEITAPVNRVGS